MSETNDSLNERRFRFAIAAIASAAFAGVAIPGQPPGINVVTPAAVGGFSLLWLLRERLDRSSKVLGALALLLVSTFALRSAVWVLTIDLFAALMVAAVATSGTQSWAAVLAAPFRVAKIHRGLTFVLNPVMRRFVRAPVGSLAPVGRGLVGGIALVLTFGSLFISADPAFASFTSEILLPDWDLALIPARIALGVVTMGALGCLALATRLVADGDSIWNDPFERRRLVKAEWATALILLIGLFYLFVVLQLTALFGGHGHVLSESGLTYAEHARQGFFQLSVSAALTLAVIAAATRFAARESIEDQRLLKLLLGALCVLTLVILFSAHTRLALYEDAFGFTRLRLFVHLVILWLAGIFVIVMGAGAMSRGSRAARFVIGFSAVALTTFGFLNPDRMIAERNVDRYALTGHLDVAYLSTLSPDAVPALAELPEPLRSCALAPIARRLSDNKGSLWSFNRGRAAAIRVIEEARPLKSIPECY